MFSNAILPVAMLWENCVLGRVNFHFSSTCLVDKNAGLKISLVNPQTKHAFSRIYQQPESKHSSLFFVIFPPFTQELLIKLYKYIKV